MSDLSEVTWRKEPDRRDERTRWDLSFFDSFVFRLLSEELFKYA